MKFKKYADITEVIKHHFGDDKYSIQKFADFRGVQRTQVNRWIAKKAIILDGKPDGEIRK